MMAPEMVTFTTRSSQTRRERSSSILQRLGTISGSHPFGISCRALSSVIRLKRSRSRRMARVPTRILAALKRYGADLEKAERVNSSDERANKTLDRMARSAVSRKFHCGRPRRAPRHYPTLGNSCDEYYAITKPGVAWSRKAEGISCPDRP